PGCGKCPWRGVEISRPVPHGLSQHACWDHRALLCWTTRALAPNGRNAPDVFDTRLREPRPRKEWILIRPGSRSQDMRPLAGLETRHAQYCGPGVPARQREFLIFWSAMSVALAAVAGDLAFKHGPAVSLQLAVLPTAKAARRHVIDARDDDDAEQDQHR